jgi:hypothetical protein
MNPPSRKPSSTTTIALGTARAPARAIQMLPVPAFRAR